MIFIINQVVFRSFTGMFLCEGLVIISFAFKRKHCVHQSLLMLFKIMHPLIWIFLLITILVEYLSRLIYLDWTENEVGHMMIAVHVG